MKNIFNLRAFLNFLGRNKLYTAINIVGFSVSLTFVILLVCYMQHEHSADKSHQNKDRIFRLTNEHDANVASPVGPKLKNRYPEIEEFVRTSYDTKLTVRIPDGKLQAQVLMTDPAFFSVFSFELAEGDPARQLVAANDAVVSEEFARRAFGTSHSVIGRTLEIATQPGKTELLTVTGIVKTFPHSHLSTPDLILQYDAWMRRTHGGDWIIDTDHSIGFGLYLTSKPGADLPAKTDDILSYFKESYLAYRDKIGPHKTVQLQPLEEVYFSDKTVTTNTLERHGDRKLLTILSSVALLILIFAMINYVNLSVAQTEARAREMATRRLLGGTRAELFARMMIESVILCALSFLVALLLVRVMQPLFNAMLNTDVTLSDYMTLPYLLLAMGAVVSLGCITGIVPAAIISSFKPVEVVKGSFKRRTKMFYNRLLIGFQYLITIVLIGCTLTMILQIRHLLRTDLGYRTANNLLVDNNADLQKGRAEGLKNEWLRIPGVRDVSLCMGVPYDGGRNLIFSFRGQPVSFHEFGGDSSFFNVMGFKILRDNHTQDKKAVWLTEQGMAVLELADTASFVEYRRRALPIAGIVQDFHARDLTHPVGPAIIWSEGDDIWQFIVQIDDADLAATYRTVQEVYSRYTEGEPFEAQFADEMIQQLYEKQQRTAEILGWLTLIAIVISALGILAMATYFVRQRSMEIAVRKVFGSTNGEILKKLIANFVRYVVVAFVIAVPVIWALMRDWLAQYTSRIALSWMIFAAAGLTALLIALITVFGQSWRAANANPVDSIKR